MDGLTLLHGDARKIPMPDESVQCIVTSPPYWGLRKYAGEQELVWGNVNGCAHQWSNQSEENRDIRTGLGLAEWSKQHARGGGLKPAKVGSFTVTRGTCSICGAWRGAYGLEPSVEMYVQHSIEILRELRRVLRADGVVFWNLGDCYASCGGNMKPGGPNAVVGNTLRGLASGFPQHVPNGLKPKDLVLMPFRVALAAQADGWWIRSVIVWAKPNPMPESVEDRPTDSYEHILMLTKSARYFWDSEAVREPLKDSTLERGYSAAYMSGIPAAKMASAPQEVRAKADWRANPYIPNGRNLRNLWDFATQPYSGAHFATFPEELPRRCILAATSAKGACAKCGASWRRQLEKKAATMNIRVRDAKRGVSAAEGYAASEKEKENYGKEEMGQRRTIGWRPTCKCCVKEMQPCTVLDPFGGSGTTGRVALELGRRAVLVDIAYGTASAEDRSKGRDYERLARRRTSNVQMAFPAL